MPHSTARRLTILVLLLVLALAAPAAAAGNRPQPRRASVALLPGPLGQVLEWLDRLGILAFHGGQEARQSSREKSGVSAFFPEDGVTEAQSICLDRGAMIDPNG